MDLPESITLSREEAGLRQLVMAITMFRLGRYECAISLAGAAEDMFPRRTGVLFDRVKQRPIPPGNEDHPWAKMTADERGRFLNDARNWLKHNDRPPEVRDIKLGEVEAAIARAVSRANTMKLEVTMPEWAVEPWEWFLTHMDAL